MSNLATALSIVDLPQKIGPSRRGFRITSRELQILEYALEMKFISKETIFKALFETKESKSSRYAYERLRLLRANGYLTPQRVPTDPVVFYTPTPKARECVQGSRPDRSIPPATQMIDYRFFEHDKRVLWCRVQKERDGSATNWVSEKCLQHSWAQNGDLSRDFLPDALYTNRRGERVAFELELSPKTKERYEKKIAQFVETMQSPEPMFQRALFVACSPPVEQTLSELTAPYGSSFLITNYDQLMKGVSDASG